MLSDKIYVVSYHTNTGNDLWNPPKNSAVQLAAAITASARIHMYPYISREDCYYTDTDSVVLGQPLPSDVISSYALGMFKLEDEIQKALFLAPKTYYYHTKEKDKSVIKCKGMAKSMVNSSWFETQYADPSRITEVSVESNFKIDWMNFIIRKIKYNVKLRSEMGNKRMPVYNEKNCWVDTKPIHISDLSGIGPLGIRIIKKLRNKIIQLENENLILNERISQRKEIKDNNEKTTEEIESEKERRENQPLEEEEQ